MRPKQIHEKWTGPCKVVEVVIEGLHVVIEMESRTTFQDGLRCIAEAILHKAVRSPPHHGGPSSRRWRGERTWARRALDYSSTNVHAPGQEAGDQRDLVARWEYRGRYPARRTGRFFAFSIPVAW